MSKKRNENIIEQNGSDDLSAHKSLNHSTNITQHGEKSVAIIANAGSHISTYHVQSFADISAALEAHVSKIGTYHIERKETQTLLDWIEQSQEPIDPEDKEKRVALLLGKAGSGKSVIMKDILLALQNDVHYNVLAFKSDIFYDGGDSKDINEKANLGCSVIEAVQNAAKVNKTILIIDQIDALSAVLSSHRKPLSDMMSLINRAAKISNVRVLVSCRPYDFYYDHYFSDLRRCYQLSVGELSETEIRQAFFQNGIPSDKHISTDLLKLLSNPLNLSLFCRVQHGLTVPSIKNLTDLYALLWNDMLDQCYTNQAETVEFLWHFASLLYKKQTLSIHRNMIPSQWHKQSRDMLSKGILIENENTHTCQFMHQTLFDYIFARLFFEKQQKLEDMFETKHQGLFVRNHLKQILEYQHMTDSDGFLQNVHTILFDKTDDRFRYKYRFHIRHLVLSILASLDNYDTKDRALIWNEIFTDKLYLFHFVNTITTFAGFSLFKDWIDKKGGFFAVEKNLQDFIFTIFSKVLYSNFQETVSYMRTLCETRLTDYHRKRMIALIERQGKVDFSEDLKFVLHFLDADESSLAFPMLMHMNIIHNTDWVVGRLRQCVIKIYENSKDNESLRFHPNISHNIQLIYDDLKERFPEKAYHFAYNIVNYVATLSILDSKDDIKNSMAYWLYNHHNTHTSEFHEELVDDMMVYWSQRFQDKPHGDEIIGIDELIQTDLTIMHIVATQALCYGINQYKEYAFQYLKTNINRTFHSSSLLHYQIKLFRMWVTSDPPMKEVSDLLDIIKNIMPDWEKVPFAHPNRQHPITDIGRTRAKFDYCVPIDLLKQFPEEYHYFLIARRRFKNLENEEPNRIEMHCGYPSVKQESVDHIKKDSDILNIMRTYSTDNDHDFETPSLSGNSELFSQRAQSLPDRYYNIYINALDDPSIHIKYTIDGLDGLIRCNYSQSKLDILFCRVIDELYKREYIEQPQTNSLLCLRIDYYPQNRLHMPQKVYDFVKRIVLHPYSDQDETNNIDYNLPINRERGRAIDLLICTSYYDQEYGPDILKTIEQIATTASYTSKVGILFRMACLINVDYQRTLNLFIAITKDGNPNYYKLPIHNANPLLYSISKDFKKLIPYFKTAMTSEVGNDVTAEWLFRAWLSGNSEAKEMLFELADRSNTARVKSIDLIGRHYKSQFAKSMQEVLLHYLSFDEKELGNEYDDIFQHLSDWESSFNIQNFLDKFIKSPICAYCTHEIYTYLKSLAVDNPNYCLDFLEKLYTQKSHKHADKPEGYTLGDYELQEITEILINAYNNVRVYNKDNHSLESAMNLLDTLLEKEDVNYYLNKCLNMLEE